MEYIRLSKQSKLYLKKKSELSEDTQPLSRMISEKQQSDLDVW